jgi:hypothetical protein
MSDNAGSDTAATKHHWKEEERDHVWHALVLTMLQQGIIRGKREKKTCLSSTGFDTAATGINWRHKWGRKERHVWPCAVSDTSATRRIWGAKGAEKRHVWHCKQALALTLLQTRHK